jgi:uncharacterized protein with HEPN domain
MVESSRRNEIITKKIIREIETTNRFVAGMNESDFLADDKTQRAVTMTLINIGELSKAYTDEFLYSKKDIPWKALQATRNVAAHNYEIVDMPTVWDTVKVSLPMLQNELESSG